MHSFKENSYPPSPFNFKTPYSRVNIRKPDPTISKILSKQRTSQNNYGRSLIPAKPSTLRNAQILRNYESPSTSCAVVDDVYAATISYSESVRAEYEPPNFRPRLDQLGNVTLENSYDHSLELKMMSIEDSEEGSEKSKKPKLKETAAKAFQIKPRQNMLRILTGSVENILHWSKLKSNHHILFEVTATVVGAEQGKWKSEKIFYLSDSKSGPKLQVLYQEIDRPLPRVAVHSLVTCIGRLTARNRLQAYKVEESSEEKREDLQRISFICNRVADELVSASQTK